MKVIAGFSTVAGLLVGFALGLNISPSADVVETFNDGFMSALCAPTHDNPSVWEDGAGRTCVP